MTTAAPSQTTPPNTMPRNPFEPTDTFPQRHIGPNPDEVRQMLAELGYDSLDALSNDVVPAAIRLNRPLKLEGCGEHRGEHELLDELKAMASQNKVYRSFIGMGYHGTITPPVILRNILENPGWYTQYTPYQAEISQGRLEALLNFQTMVADLTGLPLANASLLDEATAAAEAMTMCHTISNTGILPVKEHRQDACATRNAFFVAEDCHPQTIAVVRTRAESLGIELIVGPAQELFTGGGRGSTPGMPGAIFGVLLQYPTTDGRIVDYSPLVEAAHKAGALVVAATDLLACTLIKPPGEWGADIAIGSAQRFGVPMGYGGPHAAFMATRTEYARQMPGRLVGVSKDAHGNVAYRLAIQTREQHIKRERATSNICTAQVLLAIMAGMYAAYHGPKGLRKIAKRVHGLTVILAEVLRKLGHDVGEEAFFDTLRVRPSHPAKVLQEAINRHINLRDFGDGTFGISLDETTTRQSLVKIVESFGGVTQDLSEAVENDALETFARTSEYLTHPIFSEHHSETEMLRYLHRLQAKDLSLTTSMIPLGSCTMKLNATSQMIPVTWPEFAHLHPFAPDDQAQGYRKLFDQLEAWLAEITGFAATSLQPNAGSQGEYAGLLAIRAYHEASSTGFQPVSGGHRQDACATRRNICLIPTSAHGTNPASAVMAGFKVVPVACDKHGNINLDDLRAKAEEHKDDLAALMITYPSTHGVFEPNVGDVIKEVHQHGGLVYMDGANMNAQVGLCRPGDIGADVCHLNLHKTFCIPHGGGGPGVGPICVNEKLKPFLPGNSLHSEISNLKSQISKVGPVSAAPFGSAAILPIPWVYIALMGPEGLKKATQVAILNANYMAHRLKEHYPILYTGLTGRVAHEFILDCRAITKAAGVGVEDIAKRLMDYGFHAPTMSFPVAGTLMIEPTESESLHELDRLCDALISIRKEIAAVERGEADKQDNVLRGSPHTAAAVTADDWSHKYSRQQAAYPAPWLKVHKYWPPVGRIDNPYGDRNLVCACPPMESYEK